ncbi:MAG TPA: GNAT family N-acetyltransferase [Patescibacteria group bacterium]|jgi:ribosomal protein S18 acetylase RimI-like enzyme
MDTETDMKPETPESGIQIAEATAADVPGIAQVRKASWRDTYPNEENGISKEAIWEYTQHFDHPDAIEKRQRNWDNGKSWIAKDGDRVVGFIYVTPSDNEINALYVHPDYLNGPELKLNIGKQLVEKAIEQLDDARNVDVWVAAYNARAIRFYRKVGFVMTTEEKSHKLIGRELKMVRPAAS